MSEKLYGVDQFYPGNFAPILTGVYSMMRKSIMDLERLETKLMSKKCRLHSMEDVKKASEDAIGRTARRWV